MLFMLYIRMFKRIFKVRLLFLTIRMRDIKLTFERVILKIIIIIIIIIKLYLMRDYIDYLI